MALQYSGGTIVNQTFTVSASQPSSEYAQAISNRLVTAGWTRTLVPATSVLTCTANPLNNETVTVDSTAPKVYTFKAAINNAVANEVAIGVDLATSLSNLKNAINAGPGAGSAYSSATTAHTTVTAANTATTLTVTKITGGLLSNDGSNSETLSNGSWGGAFLGGYDQLMSAKTAQGLRCQIRLALVGAQFYNPGTKFSCVVGDRDGVRLSDDIAVGGGTGIVSSANTYRFIGNRYGFVAFAVGSTSSSNSGNWLFAGVPYLPDFLAPYVINAATNASPIQVTTSATHDLTTGQQVTIVGAEGNTAANGTWTVTVLDANNFTLNSSVGNGTYTTNSAVCANVTAQSRVWESFFGHGTSGGGGSILRNTYIASVGNAFTSVNALTIDSGGGGDQSHFQFVTDNTSQDGFTGDLVWFNARYAIMEPILSWGKTLAGAGFVQGQLYNAALVRRAITLESTMTFDGHDWMCVGTTGSTLGYSLLVAIT